MKRFYFYGLNFLLGFVSLATEIIIARALAPYWGAGTIVWGFVVGFVLLVLALGYWYGGKLADRYPDEKHLVLTLLPAALALVPLAYLVPENGQLLMLFCLFASLALFFMGAGAPWVLRVLAKDIAHTGELAGRLFAFSTIGSFLGSLLSVLFLLPFLGTRLSFLTLAFLLLFYLALRLPLLFLPGFLLLPLLFFTPASEDLWSRESRDQLVRVVEDKEGRRLVLNNDDNTQSFYKEGRYLTGDYWDSPLYLWKASGQKEFARVLILGNGAGTSAKSLRHFYPETTIDAVEVDPAVNEAARRFFSFREDKKLTLFQQDARVFVREHKERYNMIFLDVYDSSFIPFQFATCEFYQEIARDITNNGVVLVNVNASGTILKRMAATGRCAFPNVRLYRVRGNNILLFARKDLADQFTSPLHGRKIRLERIKGEGPAWSDDKSDIDILLPF